MVLSYIDDKRKLELIKYNKTIQNKLDINITYYILGSRKYLIFDTLRKVREYNKEYTKLIFEGEYLNGKRNGKGRGIENCIIYEGEYLNGKRNGKGKEYDSYGTLLFVGEYLNVDRWNGKGFHGLNNIVYELKNGKGVVKEYYNYPLQLKIEVEYLNGKRNGKGKEYYYSGSLKFEGEYLNGKRWNGKCYNVLNNIYCEIKNGKGFIKKYYNNNQIRFEGEYLKGEKNGKGKEYYLSMGRLKFEGEYLNGKRNGKGKEYNQNGKLIFEGEFKNDNRIKGKVFVNERLEFEGEYLFNKKWNGKGYDEKGNIIYELKNGNGKIKEYNDYGNLEFEGEYLNGIKWNGKGQRFLTRYELNQGKGYIQQKNYIYFNYEGECIEGELNGKGKMYYPDKRYEGEFKINYAIKEGYGTIYYKNGDIYEGEFKNDMFNGIGIYHFKNGDRYEGEFKDGMCNGIGIYYFYNGGRYEGLFKNGIYDGYGTFYSTLDFKYEGYFKASRSLKILIIIYQILLFLKKILFMPIKNKMTLFLIIILILGILINY